MSDAYQISEATITLGPNRAIRDGLRSFDVTHIIVELNIYENLYSPYLTGNVILADTNAISSLINFQGQESFTFKIQVEDQEYEDRRFVIYKVASQTKSISDSSSVLNLHIIEEHAYLSYFKRLRGSYAGNIGEIIDAVLGNELDTEIEIIDDPAQTVKVLACNRSPLDFCQWLTNRATSDYGEPFFFYSTMKDGLKLRSLGSALSTNNRPIDGTFRYSSVTYQDIRERERHESFQINALYIEDNDDMIKIARRGAVRGTFFNIDPLTASINYEDFNAQEHFERKNDGDLTSPRTLYPNTLFDQGFTVGEDTIADLPSTYTSQINTTSLFPTWKSYGEGPIEEQVHKIARESDLTLLGKEAFDIEIDGYHMLAHEEQSSVGTVIDVLVPKDQPSVRSTDEDRTVDKKRSGFFLITNVRHRFTVDGDYKASLSLARLGSPDNINDPNRQEETPG